MSRNPHTPSMTEALETEQELPAKVRQAAYESAQTAGRAREVDFGGPQLALMAKALPAPAPTQKGVKLTVELPEDVWKALKTYCTDNRTSGQKVMAALITNFLKNQA